MDTQARHPAWEEERAHLEETLQTVREETERAQRELEAGHFSEDPEVDEALWRIKAQTLHQLRLAEKRTYFTRVDFTPEREGRMHTYYIGKWGVMRTESMEPVVVDWRAPVANLYYAGQIGPVRYRAPDGEIAGTLSLKRQLGVSDGKLETIFDTDVAAQDAYLMGVLGEARGDRLRDVVSTIQAEQNVVIRHRAFQPLIVQGVAGSGKTTIALHRIAYLLYAYRGRIAPAQMMILAPNPLFLDYISATLPDLGVEQVVQTTFRRYAESLLGKRMPRVVAEDRLARMLAGTPEERAHEGALLRFCGSLRMRDLLLRYLEGLEQRLVPEGDVTFGAAVLYTNEQLRRIFLDELAMFPFERRVREMPKYLLKKRKAAQAQAADWYQTECERRADQIMASMPDGPERRARMIRLYDSRDKRLEELAERGKAFEKETMARWPRLDLLAQYGEFFSDAWNPPISQEERPLWDALCGRKREMLEKKRVAAEDLAPLLLMAQRIFGLPRRDIRHTVIDEAQDFSPLQFWLLRELTGNTSFTIVGDLMQGVHAWEGIEAWEEITGPVFDGRVTLHPLRTSYRSTMEIMLFASRVARKRPVPGQQLARPVLRHGEEPSLHACAGVRARNEFLARQAERLRAEGWHTVAIIDRDAKACAAIAKALPASLHARLVHDGDTRYEGGVLVIPASLVKGLEFDCVLMADVSETSFPDDALDARLLYVCLTRPLHRLLCCYIGRVTPLLEEE